MVDVVFQPFGRPLQLLNPGSTLHSSQSTFSGNGGLGSGYALINDLLLCRAITPFRALRTFNGRGPRISQLFIT